MEEDHSGKRQQARSLWPGAQRGDVHGFVLGVSRKEEEAGRRLWRDGGSLQVSSSGKAESLEGWKQVGTFTAGM